MISFTVETDDLRRALQSVVPHVDPDPDFPPLHRVHVDVARVNATVTATNRYSAGLAIVSVIEHDGDLAPFDLSPTDVKELLSLFRGKAGKDDSMGDTLRIDVDDQHVKVTDTSGLFDGKALTLLRIGDETNFPRLPALISRALNEAGYRPERRLCTSGKLLRFFTAAAAAYGKPLLIEPTGHNASLLLSCGESFLGLLMPLRQDDDTDTQHDDWRRAWTRRLPDPATTDVVIDISDALDLDGVDDEQPAEVDA